MNTTRTVIDQLMDVLTASEAHLILTALDARQRELTRLAKDCRRFVDDYPEAVGNRELHLGWAANDEHQAEAINALLAKLRA